VLAARDTPPVSLHPLYLPDSVIAADGLVGTWADVDDGSEPTDVVRIAHDGVHRLTITFSTDDGSVTGWGYATAIDGVTFVDMGAPVEPWQGARPFPTLPVHVFARYRVVADSLFLDFVPGDDWVARLADRPGLAVRQDTTDPEHASLTYSAVVLTPPTPQLRALVRDLLHAGDVAWKTLTLARLGTEAS
jgi:hypothetical protein